MLRRRKGPSQFPGGRKDAGTSCLPRVSPSTSPHPLPIPSIPASDPSRCFWVRTILPTASLLPLFTCTPPGTVGVTTNWLFLFWREPLVVPAAGLQTFRLFSSCVIWTQRMGYVPGGCSLWSVSTHCREATMLQCLTMPASATPTVKSG